MRDALRTLPSALLTAALFACEAESSGSGPPDSGYVPPDSGGDAGSDAGTPPQLIVPTVSGQIEGSLSQVSADVRAFLGIPFGAPPVGDKRWKAPEPPAPWEGVRAATAYGPDCPQNSPNGSTYVAASSEDCLYLNVWTPAQPGSAKLPVMVWISGGAYVFGNGGPPYNGEKLVQQGNVVVVTMNYRLGSLGYLAHPGITAAAGSTGAKANFGLLDQRLALSWVRDNISAFGGDPNSVTLFGESAGANSVFVHLLSEGSWPLFQRTIVQSGLPLKPVLTLAEAEEQGVRAATALGCTQADPAAALACMRALPAESVTKGTRTNLPAAGGIFYQVSGTANVFMPVIDGMHLKEQPEAAFKAGHMAKVPVLHGVTVDEGTLFHIGVFGDRQPTDANDYEASLTNRFGAAGATEVVGRYPAYATDLVAVTADAFFRCPEFRLSRYMSQNNITHYLYRFALTLNVSLASLSGKAFHSADIPYVFGNSYVLGMVPAERASFSQTIMGYWTRFARTGDPNGGGAPAWTRYDNTATSHLNLAEPIAETNDLGTGCDFWDDVPISAP